MTELLDRLLDPALGYAVVRPGCDDLTRLADWLDDALGPRFRHIPVFQDAPEWKGIRVDPAREDYRVGGTGLIPLHIDFVNATMPPDVVAFFCAEEDSLGGGASLIYPISRLARDLPIETLEALKGVMVDEGRFFNLNNLGEELRPFPVLGEDGFFRFTGKILRDRSCPPHRDVLEPIDEATLKNADRVKLGAGDVLLLDQRRALHGREPLGACGGVHHTGRLLYQRFYRDSA